MIEPISTFELDVRRCSNLAEYDECVRVEHAVWGEAIAVPSAVFVVAHHTGGQVVGAFHQGKMAGFALALAAMRAGKPFLHSHMTAVLAPFRDRGVGRRLKLFQRQDALKRGIDLIEWTFDPLEVKNAHFNFVRLGAVSRRYIPDCYGRTSSPLHGGLPTDRLVAEWWVASPRVAAILKGTAPRNSPDAVLSFLPASIRQLVADEPATAESIQTTVRAQFEQNFRDRRAAVAFEFDTLQ